MSEFRRTPGIPFSPEGICATIDANALRAVYGDAFGWPATDADIDAFARERYAELMAEKALDKPAE